MSDIDRVRGWIASGELLPPDASVPNTVDLARALASMAGADGVELGAGARNVRDAIGEREHLVFALIDGLGLNLIETLPADSFLREHIALELRAVFPATTATALTTLATCLWPGQHGATGWWTYLPQHKLTATILLFLERFGGKPLDEHGVAIEEAYPIPSLMPSYQRDTQALLPQGLTTTAFSRYVTDGTSIAGYETFAGAVDHVVSRIDKAARPTYTYLYYPNVDGLEHTLGWQSAAVRNEVLHVDAQLGRLAQAITGRGRVVVSADHGLLDVPDEAKLLISPGMGLLERLAVPPSGEPRTPYFHVLPGERERFASAFREHYGEQFALLTADEADELRLFGPNPISEIAHGRIGDYAGLCATPTALVLSETAGRESAATMRGFHGGMTAAEMRIALIVG